MTKRIAALTVLVALVGALVSGGAIAGCAKRTVSVQTGERVVCTYGEEVTSTVRTIRVPAKEAGKYSVTTRRITCDRHAQLQKLYSEAQTALGKQDFTTAQAKLAEVVKIDATYKLASSQLADLKSGKKPSPDGSAGSSASTGTAQPGSGTATKPGETAKPEGPVASLLIYTPDSIAGYRAQAVGSDAFSVSRQYLPTASGDIASLVIVAEQYRSAQAAKSWLETDVKRQYAKSARNVRIDGRDAYLATDGRRFAIIAWVNGPIGVAIEADVGDHPADAFAKLEAVASGLPK